jgi:hypothetical protein
MSNHTFVNDNRYSNFSIFEGKKRRAISPNPKVNVIIQSTLLMDFMNKNRKLAQLRAEGVRSTSSVRVKMLSNQIEVLQNEINNIKTQNQSNLVKNVEGAIPTQVLQIVEENPTISQSDLTTTIQNELPQEVVNSTPTNIPSDNATLTPVVAEDKIISKSQNQNKMELKKLIVPALVIGAIILIVRK